MTCTITWNELPLAAWEERFAALRRANLLQSYDYACAVCPLLNMRACWGLISIDGREAGLVQLLEVGLFGNAVHALQLDRGPLWFSGYGGDENQAAFFAALAQEFPARPLRRRRLLPEWEAGEAAAQAFATHGYRALGRPGYATIWLDIARGDDELRAGLRGKWRNRLNVAEKAGFAIEWDWRGQHMPALLQRYEDHKAAKGYRGPPARLLRALARRFVPRRKMLTGVASLGGVPAGMVLFFLHGGGATYQTGWASDEGKKNSAHNILLWQACGLLREAGIRDLDLGGINDDDSAAGIKLFKEGLGGETVRYAAPYR